MIGGRPVQVPSVVVSVKATAVVPLMTGNTVLTGAVAAGFPGAPRPATIPHFACQNI